MYITRLQCDEMIRSYSEFGQSTDVSTEAANYSFFTALNESLTALYTETGPGIVYFWSEKRAFCTCFNQTSVEYIDGISLYY